MKIVRNVIVSMCLVICIGCSNARTAGNSEKALLGNSDIVKTAIDWRSFLACHDMVWKRLPGNWRESRGAVQAFLQVAPQAVFLEELSPVEPQAVHPEEFPVLSFSC